MCAASKNKASKQETAFTLNALVLEPQCEAQ